jgi:DNA-binding NarL/FixJ family response regulator
LKPRILLVDDHELVRKGISCLLILTWEVCGEAQNGMEAIESVLHLKPDLVLLDLSMPVMGGTIAAREIRRVALKSSKIVLLSVHESDSLEALAKLVGADAFLSKGCSTEHLRKTIAALLM